MDSEKLEKALNGAPPEIDEFIRSTVKRLDVINGDFEEQLLDRELWSSVDLLQNMGIQHHALFEDVIDQIQSGADVEVLKDRVRQGRVGLGDWLFARFKDISLLESPNTAAVEVFEHYLEAAKKQCENVPQEEITLIQHEDLFRADSADSKLLGYVKGLKRFMGTALDIQFKRNLSPRLLVQNYLTYHLPKELVPIGNMVGEAEFFLLRRVKSLYEELDETYNIFLGKLDDNVGEKSIQRLVGTAEGVRDEIDESFKLVGIEVMKYYDDIRQSMEKAVDGVLLAMIEEGLLSGSAGFPVVKPISKERVKQQQTDLIGRLKGWGGYLVGYAGFHSMELEMAHLQNALRNVIDDTVLQINSRLWSKLQAESDQAIEVHRNAIQGLRELAKATSDTDTLQVSVDTSQREIVAFIEEKIKNRLQSIATSAEVVQMIDLLSQRFHHLVDETTETFQIIELEDLPMQEGVVPTGEPLKHAPMRAVVRAFLEQDLTRQLGDVNRTMLEQIDLVERAFEQLGHAVSYSMGTVAVELREEGKDPRALLGVALRRLRKAEDDFTNEMEHAKGANATVNKITIEAVAGVARRLRQMVLDESVREMKREISRAGRKKAVRSELQSKQKSIGEDRSKASSKNDSEREEEQGRTEILGYESISGLEHKLDEKVPFSYRRLFRTTPLEVSEFLKGRSEALGTVEQAVERWKDRLFSSIVLVGEQGSGKTSLVNCVLEEKLYDMPVVRRRVRSTLVDEKGLVDLLSSLIGIECADIEEFKSTIQSSKMRRVIIIEDIHQLYVRSKGGLGVMRALLDFIDATSENILWFVTIDLFAWKYLDYAISLSRHFAFLIETGQLGRGELERAIMARHGATGFGLRFAIEGGSPNSAKESYFDDLNRLSSGNVFAAIFYWLQSIESVEKNIIVVGAIKEIDLTFLHSLPLNTMVDLGMIVQHGSLTPQTFGGIFHLDPVESRARLVHLLRLGMLREEEAEGACHYSVNPLLYHPVVLELRRRNIVQ